MFRFLHAADLHIDSPLRGLERYEGAPVEAIRGASRRALENLVGLAISEGVAFVVIAGDLYDGDLPDYGACLFLNAQMLRLRDHKIRAFVIQGNHDAQNKMTRHLRLPDNVTMLPTDKVASIDLPECGARIHGRGFAHQSVPENLAKTYPHADGSAFHLGILHTSLDGREGHDRYAPCSVDDLRALGYGYWALGHIHGREVVHEHPRIVFPGNIQGRHVREDGSKGCYVITVDRNEVVDVSYRPLDVMRWERSRVEAQGAGNDEELMEKIRKELEAVAARSDDRMTAVRVEVVGTSPIHDQIARRVEFLTASVRAVAMEVGGGGRIWIEKVRFKTRPDRTREPGDGPIRTLLDYLGELRGNPTHLAALGGELADLKKKLPRELKEGASSMEIDSLGRLEAALELAGSWLVEGLRADEADG